MRLFQVTYAITAGMILVGTSIGQDREKPRTDGGIVLIDAKTEGVAEGVQIRQIETPKGSTGKREIKDARAKGKDQPRLNGIWVVKDCTITLSDGKALPKREVLIAIEVGQQTLKNVKFVERCQAQTEKGIGQWYAYTAEYEVRE